MNDACHDACHHDLYLKFNQTTWKIEDNRLPRYRRVDQFSAYCGAIQHGYHYLIDSVRELSYSMSLSDNGKKKVFDFPINQPGFSRHCTFQSTETPGLILFLHDLGSSSWQWRYVVDSFRETPEFYDYKFWVPDLNYTGTCQLALLETVRSVSNGLTDFAMKNPNAFVYLIGTSNGARMAGMIETQFDVQTFKNIHLRFVSISGFFGPSDLARNFDSIGALKYMGYPEFIRDELVKDECHEDFLSSWNKRQKIWNDLRIDVRHIFYASVDNERLYPVSKTSFPKLQSCNADTEYILVTGWDHYSLVDGLSETYLSWCKSTSDSNLSDLTLHEIWTECYLGLDKLSQISKDPREREACEIYKNFLIENERRLKWSRELLFEHFSHNLCLGDLINKGLELPPKATTTENRIVRNALQQDIHKWVRIPAPEDMA